MTARAPITREELQAAYATTGWRCSFEDALAAPDLHALLCLGALMRRRRAARWAGMRTRVELSHPEAAASARCCTPC